MHEFEIKLQLDVGRRPALEAELSRRATTQRVHLQAAYFDTAERDLAHAGMALRLRKEGRRWIQTLKAAGPDALSRFEHNVPVVGRASLVVDAERHRGTPVGDHLLALLAEKGSLQEMYRTDVWRRSRSVRGRKGTLELALDVGHITSNGRRVPVCEFEIELLGGHEQAVLEAARRWCGKYPLWLDIRSKAERGDRLARGATEVPARKAQALKLGHDDSVAQGWRAMLASTLEHILANACELADGSGEGEHRAEQVHQVRVGLRRLRSALRFFGGWPGVPDVAAVAEASRRLFGRLGTTRDRDVLMATVAPALRSAGAPHLDWPQAAEAESPAQVLREAGTQMLWLDLLAWMHGGADEDASPAGDATPAPDSDAPHGPAPADSAASLRELAARRLRRWHKAVVGRREEFMQMADVERHTLRKRIKRLRYAVDFVGSLFLKRKVKRYLSALSEAQEVFGQYNDLCMAADTLAQAEGPGVWFARGWLVARREAMLLTCQQALDDLAAARKFWKK